MINSTWNKRLNILGRAIIANCGIAFVIFSASFLPVSWLGISGRDFRPQVFVASFFILLLSLAFRLKFKWSVSHLLLSLIPPQFIVLFLVSFFTGYSISQIIVTPDLLLWLLLPNLFISLPWILGIFWGSYFLNRKKSKIS